ncbi:MAG: arginine--tRNA ligase [Alphaproteobacteria bacterium]|nr:arginine--tRNA ligase [Alphaproteobacteria bacterium]
MNVFQAYKSKITDVLGTLGLPDGMDFSRVTVEPPRDASHGDMATNAAMVLAKQAGQNPRQLGEAICEKLKASNDVKEASVAGPGFVNFRLSDSAWADVVRDILQSGTAYGQSDLGKGIKVNIEYVSANPTGPMHAGHVRGAVIGDVLAGLMAKAGYDVTREYYFNDAGAQVDVLARTTHLRYREALGESIEIPEGMYPGEYLKDVGNSLADRDGDKWVGKDEAEWIDPVRTFAVDYLIEEIKKDLALIGIKHDVFTNEREIVENGTLADSFKKLEDLGLIYQGTLPPPKGKEMSDWEPVELTLFRSSNFGDSTDRPLKKRDGTWAYIMPDIAYHYDKVHRGFDILINCLGKDHGGYLERMRPAVKAFSNKAQLDVIFNGIVKILKNGEPVKLSKRSGNLITLREMVEEVGAGAVRFFMLARTPDSELEFDFTKAVEQSKDNPVFYVQYAHARCHSVLRNAKEALPDLDTSEKALVAADLSVLKTDDDLALVRVLANWPRVVEAAAEAREPHRISTYLQEVAAAFHSFWSKGRDDDSLRFIMPDNKPLSLARLALVQAMATVIASGLGVMGVEPVEEM